MISGKFREGKMFSREVTTMRKVNNEICHFKKERKGELLKGKVGVRSSCREYFNDPLNFRNDRRAELSRIRR